MEGGKTSARRVYVYDASRADLRGRVSQLRSAGISREWDVVATESRNQLLWKLHQDISDGPRVSSVALLDSRAEPGDLGQIGFRLAETIRRHGSLWQVTRPLVWVDELFAANVETARGVRAEAVVDDDWIDRGDGEPLKDVLRWAWDRDPRKMDDARDDPRVFSDREVDQEKERQGRDAYFERCFGFSPDELDYLLLWGMADAVELSFLYDYLGEQGLASSARAARKACEKLQAAMRPDREQLDRPEPTNAEIARQFLSQTIPEPNPLEEISWPGFEEATEILAARPEIVSLAFLEPDASDIVQRFLRLVDPNSQKAADRHFAIEEAIARVAQQTRRSPHAVRGLIQRSLHSLDDAHDDWRRHGAPDA